MKITPKRNEEVRLIIQEETIRRLRICAADMDEDDTLPSEESAAMADEFRQIVKVLENRMNGVFAN